MNWRAFRWGTLVIALWLQAGAGAQAARYPGSVIDGETGKPLAGVWVIGHVMTGGGFVQGGSGCEIAIAQSGEDGRYVLDTGGGLLGLLSHASRPGEYLYKPGYREDIRPAYDDRDKKPFVMVPDRRTIQEQLLEQMKTIHRTDCGTEYLLKNKQMLLPLYQAAAKAASAVAESERERIYALDIQRWAYLLESGSSQQTDNWEQEQLLMIRRTTK